MLDWNDLRVVLAIDDVGSLAAAARTLSVHQTTVGRRLSDLEEALGVSLFVRGAHGLSRTAEGERLLGTLRETAEALLRLEQRASAESSAKGLVRLAITDFGAQLVAARVLPVLAREHPEISLELVPANLRADLARSEVDLAVRLLKPDGADLMARKVGEVRHGLYASRSYLRAHGVPPPGGNLDGHTILAPTRELEQGPEAGWLRTHAASASVSLRSSSLPTLAFAAERGLGLTVLPTNFEALYKRLVRVRRLDEIPPRPVWLVLHKEFRRVKRIRVVAELVRQELSAVLAASL